MNVRASLFSVLAVAALVILPAASADAYVCTPVTDADGNLVTPAASQVWVNRCIPYYLNRGNSLLSGTNQRLLVQQSFAVWSANPCTDLEFLDIGYTDQEPAFDPAKGNNQNVITSVEDPAEIPNYFPEPDMVAITITAFSTSSGEIFDADIAINGADFDFADVMDEPACLAQADPPFDLRSILVHEMGHFIGFDHSSAAASTMFFSAPACEVQKRTLSEDDLLGVCTVYATGKDPMTCAPAATAYDDVAGAKSFRNQCEEHLNGGGGCRCTQPGASSSAWWALLGLPLLGLRRKQR